MNLDNSIRTFDEAVTYLYSFVSFEQKKDWDYNAKILNLERFRDLLGRLGHPQNALRSIHIAGSDGKGSTCVMIASVLQQMGYRVGLYISPHLESIRERISINQEWISEADFIRWTQHLRETHEDFPLNSSGYATFFELMTAMAFLSFQDQKVDFAVIETGLGGRLDATNVMHPLVTVITHLSREHTDRLGNTLEQIADEKLGINRSTVPVVIGHQEPEIMPHLRQRLENHEAEVVFVDDRYRILSQSIHPEHREINYMAESYALPQSIHVALRGIYQQQNVLTAIAALETLSKHNHIPSISENLLDIAFRNTNWPGRFEQFLSRNGVQVVMDVAHTAKGADALRESLEEHYPGKKIIFVMGFLFGKKIQEIYDNLVHQNDIIILTQAPSPRGLTVEQILNELNDDIRQNGINFLEADPKAALRRALALAVRDDVIVVTGSLYLVGELRKEFVSI